MEVKYCRPEIERSYTGGYVEYRGFHLKPLRVYDTEYEAQQVADTYNARCFYCEWGRCWHISGR